MTVAGLSNPSRCVNCNHDNCRNCFECRGHCTKRDTIKSLAKEISVRWPDLRVTVERGFCDTDRKIGRLRHPGKGRWGSHLKVYDVKGTKIFDHNNAETYRCTAEVRDWMVKRILLEGTSSWEVEHRKAMRDLERRK